jgi:hypothetical protein
LAEGSGLSLGSIDLGLGLSRVRTTECGLDDGGLGNSILAGLRKREYGEQALRDFVELRSHVSGGVS